jgi:hypothetical protein
VPLDQAGHFALVPNAGEVFTGAQVMDALGRMVLTYHWSAGPQDIIDLSADAPGVYLVSITDGRSSWTVRVVR